MSDDQATDRQAAHPGPLLRPEDTAFLLIDMQNDFVSSQGKMAQFGFDTSSVKQIVPALQRLLRSVRDSGFGIIHTRMINDIDQNPGSWYAFWGEPAVTIPGSWGAEFIDELKPLPEELIIPKYTYGAFTGTNLNTVLRRRGVETLVVTGTGPNICAGDTMHQAFSLGYHVIAVSDCLASFSRRGPDFNEKLKEVGLYIIENHYGRVMESRDIFPLIQ